MTLDVIAFWAFAILLVGAGLAVVVGKNLFHSVLWLALALISTAGIFLTLNAEFLAAVQVLLYAGGVVTVVVFAIVVTERLVGERLSHTSRHLAAGTVVSLGLFALLVRAVAHAHVDLARPALAGGLTRPIGASPLPGFALPFWL